ncbi:class I SAM-dependent methyltransferase [Gordonia phthalatica]|uniref:class I SAM-dependent methyltransferase n=1 Tax=Gordonia phthalatica TaxID=1136941 RepID=UPI0007845396|nr:class I SAM-dependent methyltransferase [Gordonia phthalatica]
MDAQPGYDALAEQYASTFPSPFVTVLERHAVDAFAEQVRASAPDASVIDVGCGTGGVAAHLTEHGLSVRGVDPSEEMLAIARRQYPHLSFEVGDADLDAVDLAEVHGVVARFSLIHLPPDRVRATLADWASRLPTGAWLLVATQASDDPGVHEFDHHVARAWRWHPETLAAAVDAAGFAEEWRAVSRPDVDYHHRFPEIHLVARCR